MSVSIIRVQFEHHREALGIGDFKPRISWTFGGDAQDWSQAEYELELTRNSCPTRQEDPKLYRVQSSNSVLVPWPEKGLKAGESASVRVRAFGQAGQITTPWSSAAVVEAGLLRREDWTGYPIAACKDFEIDAPKQPTLFCRKFNVTKPILKGRLYITALGVYEAHINGQRIGDHVLAPGWTSYKHHLAYQTFDVTAHLVPGPNVLTAQVAEGWYCGRLGFLGGKRNIWGSTIALMAKLVITFTDFDVAIVDTDSQWKTSTGSLLTSEIYNGEVCDLRLEPKGWGNSHFDDSDWTPARPLPMPAAALVASDGPPIKKIEERKPNSIFRSKTGKLVVDFGQNMVGWVRLQLSGSKSQVIKLQYSEVMEDGEVATRPLREAKAMDIITLCEKDVEWEPKFTFHGFRYVQIDGLPDCVEFDLANITAVVVHTALERTGWFECSNSLINRLHQNVTWSMRGNFLSIPTDCPQRDERLGWTGDIHVFAPTANFLYDTCGMLQSWLRDLAAEQMFDGSNVPPFFCPNVFVDDPKIPTAIWGDVAVGLPWDLYKSYGDREILRKQLASMRAWIDKGITRNKTTGLWKSGSYQFGDWLDPKAPPDEPGNSITDPILVANAYLVHITSLMHQICSILGLDDIAQMYGDSARRLKASFQDLYITTSGRIVSDSQTATALAIHFQLFKNPMQEIIAAERLEEMILKNSRFKIATGFAGTPIIGHALSRVGLSQLFYRMLYHRKVPSWLYQVTMGATTMWERWDSMLPDGTINPGEMTSFNHYALGTVADWMHSYIAGLTPLEAGWKRFRVAPIPGGDLEYATARFSSPYGMISVDWRVEKDVFFLEVSVPPNTNAEIVLPGQDKCKTTKIGSGVRHFKIEYKRPAWPPLPIYPHHYPHDDDEP